MFRTNAGMLLVWLSFNLCDCIALEPAMDRLISSAEPTAKSTQPADDAPRMLVAPFSPEKARQSQKAWADHLQTEVQLTNSIGSTLILIPSSEFQMGSHESMEETAAFAIRMGHKGAQAENYRDEHPQHLVQLTRPYFLGKHEVTRGEFRKFVELTGYQTEAEADGLGGLGYSATTQSVEQKPEYTWRNPGWEQTDKHPVLNVSWNDAVEFCKWLSQHEGHTYQLPTEAQWEFACRAGTTGRLVTGDVPADLAGSANVGDESYHRTPGFTQYTGYFPFDDGTRFTAEVGSYRENPFGLCDMHGNVWEWCRDWYSESYYANSPRENPAGPLTGTYHIYRGGGWLNDPVGCRTTRRGGPSPSKRCNRLGFRLTRTIPSPAESQ
ncbi:MAG: formylglycine-generating enzyme family protein [Planctomycetota bacterium]|nr:MAG: formylglycine-generating enzyme family protein [Planctomycetota bacterium]